MISSVNTFSVLLSLAAVAIAIRPSIEIYNADTEPDSTFSVTTKVSLPSLSHHTELDFSLASRQVCSTGV